jgi:alpha-beta hydrolase superfamily lysophospholipase
MASDPRVDLTFSLFKPRYMQTGVDPFDLERIVARIDRWEDWCAIWSDEARQHEELAEQALARGRGTSAAEAYLRAAIYYHYGKHYFLVDDDQYRRAHDSMLRCYSAAALGTDPPMERLEVPFENGLLAAYLRVPRNVDRPAVAVILPGLDACKEELHAWSDAFLKRGMATVTLDGPGQGETAFWLPIRPDWGRVIGAVIDALMQRADLNAERVGVVGQSLGALYAPRAAALEPRIKACVANCGPFDYGALYVARPKTHLSQMFLVRSHSTTHEQGLEVARSLSLNGLAENITCPLLVVFGGGDKLIPSSEGRRLVSEASGPSEFVYFEEGNHVCFNISYKFRPLTADWMAEHL